MSDQDQYDDDLITTLDDETESSDEQTSGDSENQASERQKQEQVKQTRFDKRINQLTREKKEAQEAAEAARIAQAAKDKELESLRAELAATQKTRVESDIALLETAMTQALAAGDFGKVSAITAKMAEISASKPVDVPKRTIEEPAQQQQPAAQSLPAINDLQREYMERNDWIDVDVDKTQKADGILSQLYNAGYKTDDPKMWVLLDVNLETEDKLFDKGLTKQADAILTRLNQAGFSNDDPKIKDLLKKNLKKMTAQPSPATGGSVSGKPSNNRITDTDKETMKQYNLNPDNPIHVEEWLKAKGGK
jgi:hypothetical protein